MEHYVYILKCSDRTLYTGYTNNLDKRVFAHNNLKTGARYTKARRPVKMVYSQKYRTKSEAMKRENTIKGMSRDGKLKLING
jgi:predicted GIY-YIG superfamily endonuclease